MAKELPYFKFEPSQWENGNIQMCSFDVQGVFINLCCMYWQRLGDVSYKFALQKICGGNATALTSLCDVGAITIISDMVCIDFLNEQLDEFKNTSSKNSKNARYGWEKRRANALLIKESNATALRNQSEPYAIREDKIREDKIREDKMEGKKPKKFFTPPPSFEDFLKYGLEKAIENNLNVNPDLIKLKYSSWIENGWKTGKGTRILNWKSTLLNTLPFLEKEKSSGQKEKGGFINPLPNNKPINLINR